MRSASVLALLATVSGSNAIQGFNYASTKPDGTPMELQEWAAAFKGQASLEGTDGEFTSARLYTMIRDENSSPPEPILALQAAKDDGTTSLLLGLWCSAGQAGVDREITALKEAMEQFPDLHSQIAGISVGSEDLYRNSLIANKTKEESPVDLLGPGVNPDLMLSYVNQVKGNLTGKWADIPVGHVDTWTAFTNDDNSFNQDDLTAFNEALDFFGVDAYPYFESTKPNDISLSTELFVTAYQKVLAIAGDVPVWITETGWPTEGEDMGAAQPSVENAQKYWQGVGCANFGKINTWWYTYFDDHQTPSFGVVKSLSGGTPNYNLSCSGYADAPDASVALQTSNNSTSGETHHSGNNHTSSNSGSSSTSTSASAGSSNTSAGGQSAGFALTCSTLFLSASALMVLMVTL